MQLCVVVYPLLPFETQGTHLHCFLGERERVLAGCHCHRHHLIVERQPAPFPAHHVERLIVATLREAHLGTEILREVGTLQGRPYLGIAVDADGCHTHQRQKHHRVRPQRMPIRPLTRVLVAPPLLAHDSPPIATAARRSCALRNLSWSARSISLCISSADRVSPWLSL